jgi:hypothetical protein
MRGQGKLKEIVAMKKKFNWLMMHMRFGTW